MDWSLHWIAIVGTVSLYWVRAEGALSGWSDSPTQYHVQTDEGPERFFRFQTFNGQYRRERRMDDGTVIGSYGWVDPTGLLRMTDYVADAAGYRVVNSRSEFVGVKPQPEEEKKPFKPMKHATRVIRPRHSMDSFRRPSTEPPKMLAQAPTVSPTPTTIQLPVKTTPYQNTTVNIEVSKPAESQDTPVPVRPKKRIIRVYGRKPLPQNTFKSSDSNVNGATNDVSGSTRQYRTNRPYIVQYTPKTETGGSDVFRSYTTPLRRGTGFIYRVPHQYHKEETEADGSRVGSFGYVDPFGIRRVIHYNANKTGFDHRADFKYVGKQHS